MAKINAEQLRGLEQTKHTHTEIYAGVLKINNNAKKVHYSKTLAFLELAYRETIGKIIAKILDVINLKYGNPEEEDYCIPLRRKELLDRDIAPIKVDEEQKEEPTTFCGQFKRLCKKVKNEALVAVDGLRKEVAALGKKAKAFVENEVHKPTKKELENRRNLHKLENEKAIKELEKILGKPEKNN